MLLLRYLWEWYRCVRPMRKAQWRTVKGYPGKEQPQQLWRLVVPCGAAEVAVYRDGHRTWFVPNAYAHGEEWTAGTSADLASAMESARAMLPALHAYMVTGYPTIPL